jgi:molybdenum cofactor guanylyltransferase
VGAIGLSVDRVVVLAGGGSRRLGRDKLAVRLRGLSVLDHLLTGLPPVTAGAPVVAVGARRETTVPVHWVREDPPGGGPVAGLARGLAPVTGLDDVGPADLVCLLAGDLPFAGAAVPALLGALAARPEVDAAIATDGADRDQPLLGVYRSGPLLAAVGPAPAGRSMRSVSGHLHLARVPCLSRATLDVDTERDVQRAVDLLGGPQ